MTPRNRQLVQLLSGWLFSVFFGTIAMIMLVGHFMSVDLWLRNPGRSWDVLGALSVIFGVALVLGFIAEVVPERYKLSASPRTHPAQSDPVTRTIADISVRQRPSGRMRRVKRNSERYSIAQIAPLNGTAGDG